MKAKTSSSSTFGRSGKMISPTGGTDRGSWIAKGTSRMNRYGLQARRRWTEIDPQRVEAISDPNVFFTELGEQILTQVTVLTDAILAQQVPETSVLAREAQIATATRTAEEIVFADLVEITPPDEEEEPDWEALRYSLMDLEEARADWMSEMQYAQEKAKLEQILRTGRLPND